MIRLPIREPRTVKAQVAERLNEAVICVGLLKEVGKVLRDLFEGFEGYRIGSLDLLRSHEAFRHWRKDCRGGCSCSLIIVSNAAAITSQRGVSLRETYSCSH